MTERSLWTRTRFAVAVGGALVAVALAMLTLERWLPAPERPAEAVPPEGFEDRARPQVVEDDDGTIVLRYRSESLRLRFDDPDSRKVYLDCLRAELEAVAPDPAKPGARPEARPPWMRSALDRVHASCFEAAVLHRPSGLDPAAAGEDLAPEGLESGEVRGLVGGERNSDDGAVGGHQTP